MREQTMPDETPVVPDRPVVDPALLLEALARLRAATGEPAPAAAGFVVTRAVDPALRPAVARPVVRRIPGARAGAPVLIPAGLAALLKSGYSARMEQAPADRTTTEPNQRTPRPT